MSYDSQRFAFEDETPPPPLLPSKRRSSKAAGHVVVAESTDPEVMTHLSAVAAELRARDNVSFESALEAVDALNGLQSPYDESASTGVDILACSSITLHDDDHIGFRWSHLVCLGPVDGNLDVEHVLHVLPIKPGWETIQGWNRDKDVPPEIMALEQRVVLRPGMVVAFENATPHWMTWTDGEVRMDDLFEPPPSDEELVRSPESARAAALTKADPGRYVASFLSVTSNRLMDAEKVMSIAASTSMRPPKPARGPR